MQLLRSAQSLRPAAPQLGKMRNSCIRRLSVATAAPYQTAVLGNGVQLAYIDSWAGRPAAARPPSYNTIIGLHGLGFNSAVWTPLLAHLPDDVRFLAYNQRAYAGSSPAFASRRPKATDATAAYLGDMLDFVQFAADELGIPAGGPGSRAGTTLLGWSKGCTLPIALLAATQPQPPTAFTSSLPPDLGPKLAALRSRLSTVLLYEPATPTLGLPSAADIGAVLGPVLAACAPNPPTPLAIATAMGQYVTGYAQDADTSSLPSSSIEAVQALVGGGVWEPGAFGHAWELTTSRGETNGLVRKALTESEVPVGLLYGEATIGACSEGAKAVQGWWRETKEEGKGGKRAVRSVAGMNHVGQVLMPREFVGALLELVSELGTK